jgi:apolipoprotein D and lipocalin family protein
VSRIALAISLVTLGLITNCPADPPPLRTVATVDLARYAGLWYEIVRYPNWFEADCIADITAHYRKLDDGTIEVLNACRQKDGRRNLARGVAKPVAAGDYTRLKVRFAPAVLSFLPFVWGDYQVIDLAPDYAWAVIGEPSRKYFWILAREPRLPEEKIAELLGRAAQQGYDPQKVLRVPAGDGR